MAKQKRTVYEYKGVEPRGSHGYLVPELDRIISGLEWPKGAPALDFGCGNGILTHWLSSKGFKPVGVDLSRSGVAVAREAYPDVRFSNDLSVDNISRLGPFDLAICVEVLAHCCEPSIEVEKIFKALKPGGTLLLVTPYYGYLKNLVLAITGQLDHHLTALDAGGYVRFFSQATIAQLLEQAGFGSVAVSRFGRIAPLAKVMIVTARKP
jgi:2-polyprenyl-3-methyl-5-hydroxy-6-metoxy-1,4-benzoquinol methylase